MSGHLNNVPMRVFRPRRRWQSHESFLTTSKNLSECPITRLLLIDETRLNVKILEKCPSQNWGVLKNQIIKYQNYDDSTPSH
jgi:hypothetical protein